MPNVFCPSFVRFAVQSTLCTQQCSGTMVRKVLSFDAGIHNIGVVAATVSDDWQDIRIENATCIDITVIRHNRVPKAKCKIPHTKCLADRYAHFVQEMGPSFDEADYIFVEQQPPQSAGMVFEQLLLLNRRKCTVSVHPSKIHTRFSLPRDDYDRRKEASCEVARRLFPALVPMMDTVRRQHDIADAACILKFACEERHVLWRRRQLQSEYNLEQFAYRPTGCRACVDMRQGEQTVYRLSDCPRCRPSAQYDYI